MIDHFGINVADMPGSAHFYDHVLATLGYGRVMDFGEAIGYGPAQAAVFWISSAAADASNREAHIAFAAADRSAVDAFHAAAVSLGAEVLHAPREWPEYHDGYYGAFVRDPDGNNVEAVVHHS